MNDPVEALLLDMLEWIAKDERSYADVMEAWRTSCPRLPVWESASERGLVERGFHDGIATVAITSAGREFLADRR